MKAKVFSPPTLVTTQDQLAVLVEKLLREEIVSVDTESNSMFAYQEQVCLVQFSTREEDYLVDPLTIADLSPLGPLFENPSIEKVFHAAEYDLMCLSRDFGFTFNNLFDTMISARTLGWQKYGLGNILEDVFSVRVEKKYQRANWGRRPLTPELQNYARMDTHFLIPLRHQMKEALHQANRWPIVEEDFIRACKPINQDNHSGELLCWRVSGVYDLYPREVAVLQSLCLYRDQMARKLDRPWFKVIGDQTLISVAREMPADWYSLSNIPGMTRGQMNRYGQGLLEAVRKGTAAPPIRVKRTPRPSDDYLARMDALRNWRKAKAKEMQVESGVILPKDVMLSIVQESPDNIEALGQIMVDIPWRFNNFGAEILSVLRSL